MIKRAVCRLRGHRYTPLFTQSAEYLPKVRAFRRRVILECGRCGAQRVIYD